MSRKTNKSETKATKVEAMRNEVKALDARKAQDIREAHYKAAEGLYSLAEELKGMGGVLGEEHAIALRAIEALKASLLGVVL